MDQLHTDFLQIYLKIFLIFNFLFFCAVKLQGNKVQLFNGCLALQKAPDLKQIANFLRNFSEQADRLIIGTTTLKRQPASSISDSVQRQLPTKFLTNFETPVTVFCGF